MEEGYRKSVLSIENQTGLPSKLPILPRIWTIRASDNVRCGQLLGYGSFSFESM